MPRSIYRGRNIVVVCSVVTATQLYGIVPVLAQETVGETFRKVLGDIERRCKEEKLGPYLDPADPEYRRKRRFTDCDILKLEPRDWRTEKMAKVEGQQHPIPLRWLSTPEGHFAHSIRLPDPHAFVEEIYRPEMDGRKYFELLCEAQAGEFISRPVGNVEGIQVDRPKTRHPSGYRDLVFHTNEWSSLSVGRPEVLVQSNAVGYKFIEIRLSPNDKNRHSGAFLRLESVARAATVEKEGPARSEVRSERAAQEVVDAPSAQYLVTWRGIRRPNDWEHGIYGHELIVIQKDPLAVLGFKRSFVRYEPSERNPREIYPAPCPREVGKLLSSGERFVLKVLKPR